MALILCVETSNVICSVALARDGKCIASVKDEQHQNHASSITLLIDQVLKSNDISKSELDAVALSMGPGSYTGLRIGASAVKGLAYGLSLRVIGLSTLQAMTNEFVDSNKELPEDSLFVPMIDARRMEVYTAVLTNQLDFLEPTLPVILDSTFLQVFEGRSIYCFGNGARKLKNLDAWTVSCVISEEDYIDAKNLAGLAQKSYDDGNFLDLAYFEPNYLKDFIAGIPKNKVLGEFNTP